MKIRTIDDLAGAPRTLLGALDLRHADLRDAHLEGADLRFALLEGAELRFAHLEGARLGGANLEGADLRDAHLEGARLHGARLHGAHLHGACLEGITHLWDSHDLLAELLRRAAGDDPVRASVADLFLSHSHLCWDALLKLEHPAKEWAIETLCDLRSTLPARGHGAT